MAGCLTLLLVLGVPAFDVWLLFRVGGQIGGVQTLGLLLLSAFVGLSLARRQRATALRSMQAQLAAGRMPTGALADAPMLLLAGMLFLFPGFLTDALGLLLLVPPLRRLLFALAARSLMRAARSGRVRVFGGAFGARLPGPGGSAAPGEPADGPAPDAPFGAPPTPAGSYEAAREVKELPPGSYRVRGPEDSP